MSGTNKMIFKEMNWLMIYPFESHYFSARAARWSLPMVTGDFSLGKSDPRALFPGKANKEETEARAADK